MAKAKLTKEQVHELEKMVKKGVTPEEISNHFNVSVSSIHNYKRMLKQKGVNIPDIRGKRPHKNWKSEPVIPLTAPDPGETTTGMIKVLVNDVTFYIPPGAKSVQVGKDILTILF